MNEKLMKLGNPFKFKMKNHFFKILVFFGAALRGRRCRPMGNIQPEIARLRRCRSRFV